VSSAGGGSTNSGAVGVKLELIDVSWHGDGASAGQRIAGVRCGIVCGARRWFPVVRTS